MDYLLPSELARLVLDFLNSRSCKQAATQLLHELPELKEVESLHRQGRQICSRVWNMSLQNALIDYSTARSLLSKAAEDIPGFEFLKANHYLSDQIRSLISTVRVDLKEVPSEIVKTTKKRTTSKSVNDIFSKTNVTSTFRRTCGLNEDANDATETVNQVNSCESQNEPLDSLTVVAYDDGPRAVQAIPLCSTTESTHHSPKRKGFVRKKVHISLPNNEGELVGRVVQMALNNSEFLERLVTVINERLAEAGGQAVSSQENCATAVASPSRTNINSTSVTQELCDKLPPSIDDIFKTPSKISSTVAETASRKLLEDPLYHDLFLHLGLDHFDEGGLGPRSPTPNSRPLTTPEPPGLPYASSDDVSIHSSGQISTQTNTNILATVEQPPSETFTLPTLIPQTVVLQRDGCGLSSEAVHQPLLCHNTNISNDCSLPEINEVPVVISSAAFPCCSASVTTDQYSFAGTVSSLSVEASEQPINENKMTRIPIISKTIPLLDTTVKYKPEFENLYKEENNTNNKTVSAESLPVKCMTETIGEFVPNSQTLSSLTATTLPSSSLPLTVVAPSPSLFNAGLSNTELQPAAHLPPNTVPATSLPSAAFANDASALIPVGVRDALLPHLNTASGSVVSLTGSNVSGHGTGMLTVLSFPKPPPPSPVPVPVPPPLVPKAFSGDITGPMTVTLPNLVGVKVIDKVIRKFPIRIMPSKITKRRCGYRRLRGGCARGGRNARGRLRKAPDVPQLPNPNDQVSTQQKIDNGLETKSTKSSSGDQIMIAALDAAFASSPCKLAAVSSQESAQTDAEVPDMKNNRGVSIVSEVRSTLSNQIAIENERNFSNRENKEAFHASYSGTSSTKDYTSMPDFQSSITKNSPIQSLDASPLNSSINVSKLRSETSNLEHFEKSVSLLSSDSPHANAGFTKKTMSAIKNGHVVSEVSYRGSRSTPSYKRKKSHVRILDFKTPKKSPQSSNEILKLGRSLFNSPSPSKRASPIKLFKNTLNKRPLEVVEEESSLDLSFSSVSAHGTKKVKIDQKNRTGDEQFLRTGLNVEVSFSSSSGQTNSDAVVSDQVIQPPVFVACQSGSSATSSKKSSSESYLETDCFQTPFKFGQCVLEPPTPFEETVSSNNKSSCTANRTELNTPICKDFTATSDNRTPEPDDEIPVEEIDGNCHSVKHSSSVASFMNLSPTTMGIVIEKELGKTIYGKQDANSDVRNKIVVSDIPIAVGSPNNIAESSHIEKLENKETFNVRSAQLAEITANLTSRSTGTKTGHDTSKQFSKITVDKYPQGKKSEVKNSIRKDLNKLNEDDQNVRENVNKPRDSTEILSSNLNDIRDDSHPSTSKMKKMSNNGDKKQSSNTDCEPIRKKLSLSSLSKKSPRRQSRVISRRNKINSLFGSESSDEWSDDNAELLKACSSIEYDRAQPEIESHKSKILKKSHDDLRYSMVKNNKQERAIPCRRSSRLTKCDSRDMRCDHGRRNKGRASTVNSWSRNSSELESQSRSKHSNMNPKVRNTSELEERHKSIDYKSGKVFEVDPSNAEMCTVIHKFDSSKIDNICNKACERTNNVNCRPSTKIRKRIKEEVIDSTSEEKRLERKMSKTSRRSDFIASNYKHEKIADAMQSFGGQTARSVEDPNQIVRNVLSSAEPTTEKVFKNWQPNAQFVSPVRRDNDVIRSPVAIASPADCWEHWTTTFSKDSPYPHCDENLDETLCLNPTATMNLRKSKIDALVGSKLPPSNTSDRREENNNERRECKHTVLDNQYITKNGVDDSLLSDSYLELESRVAEFDAPNTETNDSKKLSSKSLSSSTNNVNCAGNKLTCPIKVADCGSPGKNLATFLSLPPTPEKEMPEICRQMVVSAAGAMIAVPSSQLQEKFGFTSTGIACTETATVKSVNTVPIKASEDVSHADSAASEDDASDCEEVSYNLLYTELMTFTELNLGDSIVVGYPADDELKDDSVIERNLLHGSVNPITDVKSEKNRDGTVNYAAPSLDISTSSKLGSLVSQESSHLKQENLSMTTNPHYTNVHKKESEQSNLSGATKQSFCGPSMDKVENIPASKQANPSSSVDEQLLSTKASSEIYGCKSKRDIAKRNREEKVRTNTFKEKIVDTTSAGVDVKEDLDSNTSCDSSVTTNVDVRYHQHPRKVIGFQRTESGKRSSKDPAVVANPSFMQPPPTPGKGLNFLRASRPQEFGGIRFLSCDDTPLHKSWMNPFTSTPVSVGSVGSFAEQDKAYQASNEAQRRNDTDHCSTFPANEANNLDYLDRPPKTPSFPVILTPEKELRFPYTKAKENETAVSQFSQANVPTSISTNCSTSVTSSSVLSEMYSVNGLKKAVVKGKTVLPQKTQEEVAKFLRTLYSSRGRK